jgi:membrane-bound lytic murein transglycosylase B
MRTSRGVAAAALVVAMVAGTSGVAAASQGDGTPSPGGSPPPTAQKLQAGPGVEPLAQLAKRYGVTVAQLENALRNVKLALGERGTSPADPAVAAQFAQDLGLSLAQAKPLLHEVLGQATVKEGGTPSKGGGGTPSKAAPEAFIDGLAQQLGISRERAAHVYQALEKLDQQQGGIDPNSPQFAAIAHRIGLTAEQLADALRQVKMSLADSGQDRSPRSVKPLASS